MAGAALTVSSPAAAADQLRFGIPAAWVVPQTILSASEKTKDKPAVLLLHDQQFLLEPGKITTFAELAFKIQKPEGLAAGNLSVAWNPATDTVTVNSLEIRRGAQVIDVLKSGQTFTTLRRETNLDAATLDGVLTANIQPEGLQEGDVLVLSTTTEHVDPVLKGHVEATFAPWGGAQIGLAHARVSWPSNLDVKIQKTGDLPATQTAAHDGKKTYEVTMRDVEPVIEPKGAPLRYKIGRLGEATDFRSWADAAKLMAPLYRTAAVISAAGPLRDEVEKIRKASADPKVQTEQALQLVQQRIRYVALVMGQGSYVPATAETTWSRRFGDCKAKTALLLAILHELGVKADPVIVNAIAGDMVVERLPSIGMFNHVLVRAEVGGKTYWLDGTRTGDTSLDGIEVPDFGWGLPLVENAQLVHIVPAPLAAPNVEHRVTVDAKAGIYAPAPVTIEEIYRGDEAVELNAFYSAMTGDQRDESMRDKARSYFDEFKVANSSFNFDKAKRELDLTINGTGKLGWKDSWLDVPTSSIAFDPDFDRAPGPLHDVPLAVRHPRYVKDRAALTLPSGVAAKQKLAAPVHQTLAGVEYTRTEAVSGDVLTLDSSERSIAPEVPYRDALAAAATLRTLNKDDVYLKAPDDYQSTPSDLATIAADTPMSAQSYIVRAINYLNVKKLDEALADLNAGIALDPKNYSALIMRLHVYREKGDFAAAEKDISAAETLEPNAAGIPEARALVAYSRHDYPKVIDQATKAVAAIEKEGAGDGKRLASMYGIRADAEIQLKKEDEGLSDLGKQLALSPADQWALNKRAWLFLQRQKPSEAEKDIAAALAVKPNDANLLSFRGMLLMMQRKSDAAKETFSHVLEIDPNNVQARMQLGWLLNTQNDRDGAIREFSTLIARNPKNVQALAARAFVHSLKQDFASAGKDLAAAEAIEPQNPVVMSTKANMAGVRQDYSSQIEIYSNMIAQNPKTGSNYFNRASAYSAIGKDDLALKDVDQAIALGFKDAPVHVLRANLLMHQGKNDAVAHEAELMLQEGPGSDFALVAAAKTYAAIGQREKAMQVFDRALAIKPYGYIYVNRAQVRTSADVQGQLADLDQALKLEPKMPEALSMKASILLKQGKYSDALALYDSIPRLGANDRWVETRRAVLLTKAGRTTEAGKDWAALRSTAKTAPELNGLCWEKATAGVVLESALQDCRDALKLKPDSGQYLDSLGMVLLKLGKLDEALDAYNKAVARNTGADSLMGRAFVYLRKGDHARAAADAAAARKLSPSIDNIFADYDLKFPGSAPAPGTNATPPSIVPPTEQIIDHVTVVSVPST